MTSNNKPQALFHKYQKIYSLIGIIYNTILLGLFFFAFIKNDDNFNILHIVLGINGIYCLFDLITNIIFIVSKPFDQDLSKSTLIASISDTLFHNGLAVTSFVIVAFCKNSKQKTIFWKLSFWITLIILLRSLIMLASEVYWWIMLKNTLKDHTEEDFIIPEEELNTQYHQIAYDYHNPKRLFNQSNVVILNKKQKKKLNELQQEELMLQQLEQKKNTNPSNSTLDRQQQNKNRIDQYIKERIANDHESNYEYMRQHQPHQNFQGSLSSTSKLIKNKDSENESESDNDDLINLKDRNKNEQEATIVEMYSSPNNVYPRKTSISSSSSSSSSVFIHPYSQQSYPSTFRKNSNTTTVNSNTIFIDMKNNSMSIDQPQLSLHNNNNTINMEIDSAAPLSTQKNKILEYMDQLIKENKEKKQAKKKEKQDNPERYHYNHPQEWFSQMMGVKEIQEERDAKIFVRAKQKREKEIIEQKMEKLKNELNYANTSEQVEAIFNELKALNGIW